MKLGYRFGSYGSVRVGAMSMYTFPHGSAFRKQINLGFGGTGSLQGGGNRIDLGFEFGGKREGYEEWQDFVRRMEQDRSRFDEAFASLGNYTEARGPARGWRGNIFDGRSLSTTIRDDLRNIQEGSWRFFGRFLSSPADNEILTSLDGVVGEADRVFKTIASTGTLTLGR